MKHCIQTYHLKPLPKAFRAMHLMKTLRIDCFKINASARKIKAIIWLCFIPSLEQQHLPTFRELWIDFAL